MGMSQSKDNIHLHYMAVGDTQMEAVNNLVSILRRKVQVPPGENMLSCSRDARGTLVCYINTFSFLMPTVPVLWGRSNGKWTASVYLNFSSS